MAKDQLKLWLEEDLIQSLQECADRFEKRSANEVASEVLIRYLDFWIESEEAKRAVFERQRAMATEVYMKGRGSSIEADRVKRDAQARERKKRGNR